MGPAFDDGYVTDGEMMIVPEVSTKMFVVDTTHVLVVPCLFVPCLIVPFFLARVVVVVPLIVSVIVLGKDSQRSS